MAFGDGDDGPIESGAGAAGPLATEAFQLLGNQTRLSILLALWEAFDPRAEQNAMSFSDLRDRVGVSQGSQFNYHLDKLVGHFVEKTDDGYVLRRPGRIFVQSIIAGTGIDDRTLDPTDIDAECRLCGGSTQITYENANVYQVCTDCPGDTWAGSEHPDAALLGWTFEPTGLTDRTAEEVFAASTIKTFSRIALRVEDICPECSGPVEWSMDICEDHDPDLDTGATCPACDRESPVFAQEVCTVCKSAGSGSPGIKLLFHPAVVAFFYDHGIEIGFTGATDYADVVRTLDLVWAFEEEVVSTEPPRVRIRISHDGDELCLEIDEELNVLDVDRRDT